MKLLDRMTQDVLRELTAVRYRARKIERQWYVTQQPHGPFPAGTECVIWRARPDSFLVMEFADGSVAEVSYGFAACERVPNPLGRALERIVSIAASVADPDLHLVAVGHILGPVQAEVLRPDVRPPPERKRRDHA
jgi:hypothetical protein